MAQARTRSWKRFAKTSISFAMIPVLLFASPLHAANTIFQVLSAENNEPAGDVKYDQESRSMLVRVLDDNRDIVIVTLAFASNVSNSTFASSSSLLRVKFMPYLTSFKGNTGNIWLEAPKSSYQGATKIPAIATSYATDKSAPTDPRKDMSACGALTWMDDVPARNLVSFQFSRNCFDLPNSFWAVSQIETDMFNSSTIRDVRYTPLEPFFIDMTSVPKPPKIIPKKDQSISASTPQREYVVGSPPIQISASSNAGAPLTFSSRTPTTCSVTSNGFIEPKGAGNCQVAIDAAGSETLNPAATVFVSINLTKKSQNLYFDPPGVVYLNQQVVNLSISAESNLLVQVVSTSPSTCTFPFQGTSPSTVRFLAPGICSFKVTQPGDAIYNAREGFASFEISPNPQTAKPTPKASSPSSNSQSDPKPAPAPAPPPTRVTISGKASASGGNTGSTSITDTGNVAGNAKKEIICIKPGAPIKKVKAANPKCPPGYKKK
jgi:hypothetical protein